jgi:hypothetical protein
MYPRTTSGSSFKLDSHSLVDGYQFINDQHIITCFTACRHTGMHLADTGLTAGAAKQKI